MSSRSTQLKNKRSDSRVDNVVAANKNLSQLNSSSVTDLRNARTPPATNKSKSTTSLNACYTPSSLYKNLGATPKSTVKRFAASMEAKSTPECFSKVSFETPKRSANKSLDGLKCKDKSEVSNLKVAVRVRPMNAQECKSTLSGSCVSVVGKEVIVSAGHTADGSAGVCHTFNYDDVFWSSRRGNADGNDQNAVFQGTALPLVDVAFEGKNCCLFAYGQTGSGKSYSMMGLDDDININASSEAGIIPRFCQEIFQRIDQLKGKVHVEVEVSYFEIYNEKIHDLLAISSTMLNTSNQRETLRVREHPLDGPYVVNLSTHPVSSYLSLRNWLSLGNSHRATAATGMNDKSSRSHSIFNIVLNMSEMDANITDSANIQSKRSKISLVDLAGSERLSQTCTSGNRMKEGVSINSSLLILGRVIAALADSKKMGTFVPYRESVLTWLLRENLGGNSRTVMLATISPASIHIDETIATLRYACQARSIVNRVKVNEDPHNRQIRELRAEVERLQALHQDYERQNRISASAPPRKIVISVDEREVTGLRQQLKEREKELAQAQRSWMDRLKEAETLRETEMKILKRNGLALEYSDALKQTCLVNLAADPILSGTLLYILPPGVVNVGRSNPASLHQPDIVLEGPLVAFDHCIIENHEGKLHIVPGNAEFETFVNGELLTEKRQIFNGDRVVIGGSHYFRVSNPNCSHRLPESPIDFQTAHQEILKEQEARLREKLDAEKYAALQEIQKEHLRNENNYLDKMAKLKMEKYRFKCSKKILESEKKAIENQLQLQKESIDYQPYQSNLLDEIPKIFQHSSEQFLHRTKMMVKEANKRCHDFNKNIKFVQTEVADEEGIFKTVIIIIDRDNKCSSEWPPARLDEWLDQIRDNQITAENLFDYFTVEWKNCDEEVEANESLNESGISLNLSAMKDVILGKVPEQMISTIRNFVGSPFGGNKDGESLLKTAIMNSPIKTPKRSESLKSSNKPSSLKNSSLTPVQQSPTGSVDWSFLQQTDAYLHELKKVTNKLKKLCYNYNNENQADGINATVTTVLRSTEQIEQITSQIQTILDENGRIKSPKSVRFLNDKRN
ncbi:Kinesin-like protein KIF14 [Pseudolycoriella hygida]|uniref:Kinesin-like protein KIF14 n=1 Tax=Pseudolycoriella hygida TaxID=35572 RepID=A0A9Q0NDL3_9DIPT|nr:Kinesin-like protein KIF14 [Pseudolycoriella hygida]